MTDETPTPAPAQAPAPGAPHPERAPGTPPAPTPTAAGPAAPPTDGTVDGRHASSPAADGGPAAGTAADAPAGSAPAPAGDSPGPGTPPARTPTAAGEAHESGTGPGTGPQGRSADGRAAEPVSLAELERLAAERRDRPAYGKDALISCDRLVRIFTADGVEVQALQGLDLLVAQGELMALVGASGSGKSTLLNILAGLDVPTAGAASVGGYDLLAMDSGSRLRYRREVVGFIWQQTSRNLLPYLTAAQNVMLPMQLSGGGPRQRRRRATRAADLLGMLGVAHCHDRRPAQMSGGEQQRAAIAVALANDPAVVLADEPTGELDSATAEQVLGSFRTANEQLGTTVVVVTHDQSVADAVHRTVAIRDGRTASEVVRRTEIDEHGRESVVAREYATVDRAGRLQLPHDYTEALAIRRRVLLELQPDHVTVRPDDHPAPRDQPGPGRPRPASGR
jgi:ABC-type lipoprotein export system ATPase subunit